MLALGSAAERLHSYAARVMCAHDVRCAVLQFPAQSKPERGTVHAMAHILGKRSPSSVSPSAVSPSLRLLFLLRSIFGGLASPPPAPDGSKFTAALRRCRATAPKPRPGCAPSARSACDRAEASTGLMLEASRVCATLNHSTAVLEYSPPWLSIHCSASLFVLLVLCGRALWGLWAAGSGRRASFRRRLPGHWAKHASRVNYIYIYMSMRNINKGIRGPWCLPCRAHWHP